MAYNHFIFFTKMAHHIYRPRVEVKVIFFFFAKIMLFNLLFWYNDDF
jgi:hypothetical protein